MFARIKKIKNKNENKNSKKMKKSSMTVSRMNRKNEKKTRQERRKENSHPFCDGATKNLLQLNQYRYEVEFRNRVLDFYWALDMFRPTFLK